MANQANHGSDQPHPAEASLQDGLRPDVTVWGSYTWGFADTFVALGLVFAITHGAAPLAFALAGLVYILIGLAYTELASAYPVPILRPARPW
ncbi:MAG: hypothetical protein M1423_08870 [Acidobacteria bacterium]|nr:hypothetical protein [Acidobacteriota bacterium]